MTARLRRAPIAALALALLSAPAWAGTGSAAGEVDSGSWQQTGTASWYGPRFQGHRTSSGHPYDQHRMTAAHPSLPLGSRVRVVRRDTGAAVVVTIDDRQPKHPGRVIDLSRAAAKRLGMVARGLAPVRITLLSVAQPQDEEEVAEAPLTPQPRDLPRTRPASPAASAARTCCHAPSAAPARSSALRRAAPHTP